MEVVDGWFKPKSKIIPVREQEENKSNLNGAKVATKMVVLAAGENSTWNGGNVQIQSGTWWGMASENNNENRRSNNREKGV